MRRHYPRGFREEIILKFESLSPKMRYIDFAKQNNIKLETLKTWIYDSRKKKKARAIAQNDWEGFFQETEKVRLYCPKEKLDTC